MDGGEGRRGGSCLEPEVEGSGGGGAGRRDWCWILGATGFLISDGATDWERYAADDIPR